MMVFKCRHHVIQQSYTRRASSGPCGILSAVCLDTLQCFELPNVFQTIPAGRFSREHYNNSTSLKSFGPSASIALFHRKSGPHRSLSHTVSTFLAPVTVAKRDLGNLFPVATVLLGSPMGESALLTACCPIDLLASALHGQKHNKREGIGPTNA